MFDFEGLEETDPDLLKHSEMAAAADDGPDRTQGHIDAMIAPIGPPNALAPGPKPNSQVDLARDSILKKEAARIAERRANMHRAVGWKFFEKEWKETFQAYHHTECISFTQNGMPVKSNRGLPPRWVSTDRPPPGGSSRRRRTGRRGVG